MIIGDPIAHRFPRGPPVTGVFDAPRQCRHDAIRDLILDTEDVCEAAVQSFGPDPALGSALDQLYRDPHSICFFLDATLNDISDAKPAPDLVRALRTIAGALR
jgi:hypothetical protein